MTRNNKKCSVEIKFVLKDNKILSLKRELDPEKN